MVNDLVVKRVWFFRPAVATTSLFIAEAGLRKTLYVAG